MKQVFACVDGSRVTESVCDASVWVANRVDVPLTFLHALEHESVPLAGDLSGSIGLGAREDLLSEMIELEAQKAALELKQGKLVLEAVSNRAQEQGVEQTNAMQRHGALTETLSEFEEQIRVLVIGRQGQAHEAFTDAIGSHIESVIRTLHRPVLVVAEGFSIPSRFMLAYDGSATADKALQMVAESPLLQGLECHLVAVKTQSSGAIEAALETASTRLDSAGFSVSAAMLEGTVVDTLIAYQKDHQMDLTIMGAYGHSRIRQFFVGSQTTKMLAKSTTPLLLLR
jgi:nucleotide-binding universal stress UspA family protein